MSSKRLLQVAEDIRELIATLFVTGRISDPRIRGITIQRVKVTADMQLAQVFYSILDAEERKEEVRAGLQSAAGYVRRHIGENLKLRYTPKVVFILDEGIERAARIGAILSEVRKEFSTTEESQERTDEKDPNSNSSQ